MGLVVAAAGALVELLPLVLAFGAVDGSVRVTREVGERGVGHLGRAEHALDELERAEVEFAYWHKCPFALRKRV